MKNKIMILQGLLLILVMALPISRSIKTHTNTTQNTQTQTNKRVKKVRNNVPLTNSKTSVDDQYKYAIKHETDTDNINKSTSKVVIDNDDVPGSNIDYSYNVSYSIYDNSGSSTPTSKTITVDGNTHDYVLGSADKAIGKNGEFIPTSDVKNIKVQINGSYQPNTTVTFDSKYLDQIQVAMLSNNPQGKLSYTIKAIGILSCPKILLIAHWNDSNGKAQSVTIGQYGVYNFFNTNGAWAISTMGILAPAFFSTASFFANGLTTLALLGIVKGFNELNAGYRTVTNAVSHTTTDLLTGSNIHDFVNFRSSILDETGNRIDLGITDVATVNNGINHDLSNSLTHSTQSPDSHIIDENNHSSLNNSPHSQNNIDHLMNESPDIETLSSEEIINYAVEDITVGEGKSYIVMSDEGPVSLTDNQIDSNPKYIWLINDDGKDVEINVDTLEAFASQKYSDLIFHGESGLGVDDLRSQILLCDKNIESLAQEEYASKYLISRLWVKYTKCIQEVNNGRLTLDDNIIIDDGTNIKMNDWINELSSDIYAAKRNLSNIKKLSQMFQDKASEFSSIYHKLETPHTFEATINQIDTLRGEMIKNFESLTLECQKMFTRTEVIQTMRDDFDIYTARDQDVKLYLEITSEYNSKLKQYKASLETYKSYIYGSIKEYNELMSLSREMYGSSAQDIKATIDFKRALRRSFDDGTYFSQPHPINMAKLNEILTYSQNIDYINDNLAIDTETKITTRITEYNNDYKQLLKKRQEYSVLRVNSRNSQEIEKLDILLNESSNTIHNIINKTTTLNELKNKFDLVKITINGLDSTYEENALLLQNMHNQLQEQIKELIDLKQKIVELNNTSQLKSATRPLYKALYNEKYQQYIQNVTIYQSKINSFKESLNTLSDSISSYKEYLSQNIEVAQELNISPLEFENIVDNYNIEFSNNIPNWNDEVITLETPDELFSQMNNVKLSETIFTDRGLEEDNSIPGGVFQNGQNSIFLTLENHISDIDSMQKTMQESYNDISKLSNELKFKQKDIKSFIDRIMDPTSRNFSIKNKRIYTQKYNDYYKTLDIYKQKLSDFKTLDGEYKNLISNYKIFFRENKNFLLENSDYKLDTFDIGIYHFDYSDIQFYNSDPDDVIFTTPDQLF